MNKKPLCFGTFPIKICDSDLIKRHCNRLCNKCEQEKCNKITNIEDFF